MSQLRQSGMVRFHHTTQIGEHLKLMNCYFWKFPFNIFRLKVTETVENETVYKGDYCNPL